MCPSLLLFYRRLVTHRRGAYTRAGTCPPAHYCNPSADRCLRHVASTSQSNTVSCHAAAEATERRTTYYHVVIKQRYTDRKRADGRRIELISHVNQLQGGDVLRPISHFSAVYCISFY